MHAFLYHYTVRDIEMSRQKKEVKIAQINLIKKGNTPKFALKKIKKAFLDANKQK